MSITAPLPPPGGGGPGGCDPASDPYCPPCNPSDPSCGPPPCDPFLDPFCFPPPGGGGGGGGGGGSTGSSGGPTLGGGPPGSTDAFQYAATDVLDYWPFVFRVTVAWPFLATVGLATGDAGLLVYDAYQGYRLAQAYGHFLPKAVPVSTTQTNATTGSSHMDCVQQLIADLRACADKYPPGPERQECMQNARIKFRYCTGKSSGGVQ